MNTDTLREQVRALLASHRPAEGRGVVVPLKLSGEAEAAVLLDLLRRVAASPALAQACASGLLRFDLRVEPGALAPAAAPACGCDKPHTAPAPAPAAAAAQPAAIASPLLRGVVTERDVLRLPPECQAAGLAPGAVLTPLARDALRTRGIAIQKPNPSSAP